MTVSSRVQLLTLRGRRTQAAIDAAARAVIARKGFLATTVSEIAAEAGKSTASFYNYYDSKESMARVWARQFIADANQRAREASKPGLTNWERSYEAAAAYWNTYRSRLAEIISVSQLAMVNQDFAHYWNEICSLPLAMITKAVRGAQRDGFCEGDDPQLTALTLLSMLDRFCYHQFFGDGRASVADDASCITTLAKVFHRTLYYKEAGPA